MTSNTIEKTVSLPLSEAGKNTIFTKFSSDGYFNWMLSLLMPFDLLYTYFFRYGRVACNDMINRGLDPDHLITHDNGPMIDATVAYPDVGAAVTLSFWSIALVSAYWEVGRQVKNKNNTSAKYVYDQLNNVIAEQKAFAAQEALISATQPRPIEEEKTAPAEVKAVADDIDNTLDIHLYIQKALADDQHFRKKYKDIQFVNEELCVQLIAGSPQTPHNRHERKINISTRQEEDDDVVEDEMRTPTGRQLQVIPSPAPAEPSLLQKIGQGFINKFLYPVWQSTVLMSFVFWIEWIASGIFSGDFGAWSVAGWPNTLAYGLPVFLGLVYPIIKIVNYFRNADPTDALKPTVEEQATADKDMSILLRRALVRREFVIEKQALEKKLAVLQKQAAVRNGITERNGHTNGHTNGVNGTSQLDKEIFKLRDGVWLKPLLKLFSVATGSYVGAQYCTWIIAGVLNVTVGIAAKTAVLAFAGWPLLIGPLLYGCYEAYSTYQKALEQNRKIENLPEQGEFAKLENELAEYQEKLRTLGNPAPLKKATISHLEEQFFLDVKRHGPSKWTGLNKFGARLFQFINGGCTGIFLARVFFVEGSAISIPFAVAAFSYPVTAVILAGIGIGYGLIKTYEYHQARKDAHAKYLFETRTERMECLKNEVALAKLRTEVCTAEKQAQVVSEPSTEALAAKSTFPRKPAQSNGWGLGLFDCFGRKDQVVPAEDEYKEEPSIHANGMNGARVA